MLSLSMVTGEALVVLPNPSSLTRVDHPATDGM